MKKSFKKFTLFFVSIIAVLSMTFVATAANQSTADTVSTNPLDGGKEILYYLFWTQDKKLEADIENLKDTLSLSQIEIGALKELGLTEHLTNQTLTAVFSSNSRSSVAAFNASVDENVPSRNDTILEILGDKYESFRTWIDEWWTMECEYRMNPTHTRADIDRISNIWATQYEPNTDGAMEVALPDKYIKWANLGWDDTYADPPYTVNVFNPDNNATLLDIAVDEVGPWNENDNYWDEDRRDFGDLDLGVPEAHAAYYDDYNDGKDQFGRTVTNPAGIDLSTAAAQEIGFGTYVSGFVDVRYESLP